MGPDAGKRLATTKRRNLSSVNSITRAESSSESGLMRAADWPAAVMCLPLGQSAMARGLKPDCGGWEGYVLHRWGREGARKSPFFPPKLWQLGNMKLAACSPELPLPQIPFGSVNVLSP